MIIPEPKDLPGNAAVEARKLTGGIQAMNTEIARTYEDIRLKIQQGNITLQALAQQVDVLANYINTLPAASAVYGNQNTGFSISNVSYTTMASFIVPVPEGYTKTSLFVVADGIIVDTTVPYAEVTYTRLVVNGVATQPVTTNYTYYGSPPRDMFHISESRVVNGTSSFNVEVQAIANQVAQGDGDSFARVQAFVVYNQ
jgi:hypothetical protein